MRDRAVIILLTIALTLLGGRALFGPRADVVPEARADVNTREFQEMQRQTRALESIADSLKSIERKMK